MYPGSFPVTTRTSGAGELSKDKGRTVSPDVPTLSIKTTTE